MSKHIKRSARLQVLVAHVGKRPSVRFRNLAGTLGLLALAGASLPASAQAIFTDSFEGGNLSHTQGGIKWATSSNTSVYNGFGHSGSHSLKFAYPAGSPSVGSWAEQRFDLGANYPELYIEWYEYYPNGTEGLGPKYVHQAASPTNDKFLRVWSGNQSDGNNGYTSFNVKVGASTGVGGVSTGDEQLFAEWGVNGLGVGPNGSSGSQPGFFYNSWVTDTVRGRWIDVRVHLKVATSSNNNGVIEVWRDGTKVISATTLANYPSGGAGNYYNFGYLMGWANSGFAQATNVYVDDVSFSATGFGSTTTGGTTTTSVIPDPPTSVSVQ